MAHGIDLIQSIEQLNEDRPDVQPGDTVNIHLRIVEGTRERVQVFQGVVIGVKGDYLHILINAFDSHRAGRISVNVVCCTHVHVSLVLSTKHQTLQ